MADWGCFSHPDEAPPAPGDYRVCGECGHTFRTEAELIAEHKTYFTEAEWPAQEGREIYACPVCTHDF